MDVLVVGLGHIGRALYKIVAERHNVDFIDVDKQVTSLHPDIMHICFPYSDKFETQVVDYYRRFGPRLTILESTVRIGTTARLASELPVVHSPVLGNERDGMITCLQQWYTKYIGAPTPELGREAEEYYQGLGMRTKVLDSPATTELAKLLETTYYGLLIGWFQEIRRMCDRFAVDFQQVSEFLGRITRESGARHLRPTFYPGLITGPCVIQNAELLTADFPSLFVQALMDSNRRRLSEESQRGPTRAQGSAPQ